MLNPLTTYQRCPTICEPACHRLCDKAEGSPSVPTVAQPALRWKHILGNQKRLHKGQEHPENLQVKDAYVR